MKFRILSLAVLAATLIVSGCKKELDIQPTDVIAEDNAFLTLEDVQRGVNAAHGRYGTYINDMYVNALVSDEGKLGVGNSGQGALTYRYQYSSDQTTGGDVIPMYGGYYAIIDQCNRILPKLETVPIPAGLEGRKSILRGQLLALRAISYFGLIQAYSPKYDASSPYGVAILTESNPASKLPRNTVGQVMTQIESDITAASGLLQASTFSDTVMNKVNLTAYSARIALYKREYQRAIDSASVVIASGVKPLATGASFSGIWTDANTNETLFRRRYSAAADGAVGAIFTTTGGLIYIAPSDKLIAAFPATPVDVRRAAYIGGTAAAGYFINKFYNSSKGGRIVDIKAMRIAEMYLIRAEAYAKIATPNLIAGAADLNALRAARITGYVAETFSSGVTLADAVMQERFKELCFEGFRFYDLKRNSLPVQRLASDANPAWQNLPADNFRFTFPIYQSEILTVPGTIQNPGY